jgi:gliding motility-associated-like protein
MFGNGVVMENAVVKNQTCSNKTDGSIEVFSNGGEPPFRYAMGDGPFQERSIFNNLIQGTYTVSVKDKNNCVDSRTVNVGLNTTILADFDFFTTGEYNEMQFDFTGEGASNLTWDFGDGETSNTENPYHQYTFDTTFLVQLLINSGPPDYCIDSVAKLIEVYPSLQVYAPSAFTPNGDGLNDFFRIYGIAIQSYEIYIFASDGTQIFHSDNLENSWDGTFKGERLDHGVFAYVIRAKDRNDEIHEKKGTVTLLR